MWTNKPSNLVQLLPNPVRSTGSGDSQRDEQQLRTVWVGGLHEKVDDEILYELFLNAGPLEKVTIPKDRETKKHKSFAFVLFQHEESVRYACDLLSNVELFGKKVILSPSHGVGSEGIISR